MNKIKYFAALLIGIGGLALQQAQAANFDLQGMRWSTNDPYLIGTVIPGLQGNGGQEVRDALMTNTLLSMSAPSQQGTWGDTNDPLYSRTTYNTAGFPTALSTGTQTSGSVAGGGLTLVINLTAAFHYLVVSYDGPNSGTAVYDVSSFQVGDTITLSRYAFPDANIHGDLVQGNGQYLMTHWTLLNPLGVPDGGATVMLLGAALGALGMVRRYLIG